MISVIMSVYNERLEWVKESVESILNQTYKNFEFIIVIDNPSLDLNIKKYLYETQKSDSRVLLSLNEKNLGLPLSMNKAISIAKGEYLARMDADDVALPNRLEEELRFIEKENCEVIYSSFIPIDEKGNENGVARIIFKNVNRIIPYSCPVIHPTVLIRSDFARKIGGYRYLKISEDYDFWLRVISAGGTIKALNKILAKYRTRANSLSNSKKLDELYHVRYLHKLYKERLKNSDKDSYSSESYNIFLNSLPINEVRKNRIKRSLEYIEKGKRSRNPFIIAVNTFKSMLVMPMLTFEKIRVKIAIWFINREIKI